MCAHVKYAYKVQNDESSSSKGNVCFQRGITEICNSVRKNPVSHFSKKCLVHICLRRARKHDLSDLYNWFIMQEKKKKVQH